MTAAPAPGPNIDPTTLAVIRGALQGAANEMDTLFSATAFSAIIADSWDRSSGVYDRSTGEMIAQGETGLPFFIGTMQFTVQAVIAAFPDPAEGDIYLVNDPYVAGTHLNDTRMITPVFRGGEVFCFLANCGHWPDMGGMAPGGYATDATDVFQEGLRIPLLRLFSRGVRNEEVLQLLVANVRGRVSDRIGDIDAQVNALRVGEQRIHEIADGFGDQTILDATIELGNRANDARRAVIQSIPDGYYEAEDWLDDDGVDFDPIRLHVRIQVEGDTMHFDFSQSPPPVRGTLNLPIGATKTSCYIALQHIWPEVPVNGGAFRPITFDIPESSLLRAKFPSPISGCTTETTQRTIDLVFRALAPVIGPRAIAGSFSTGTIYLLCGDDPEQEYYVMIAFPGGGYGGQPKGDGLINGSSLISMARGLSLEILEHQFPVLYTRHAIRDDSAGAGEHRGGTGTLLEFELRRGRARFSLLGDRGRLPPLSLNGGQNGTLAQHEMLIAGEPFVPPHLTKINNLHLSPGDQVTLRTPGGAGWGDPFSRHPALVLHDVRAGYVSIESARSLYGVACSFEDQRPVLDDAATSELRAVERRARV